MILSFFEFYHVRLERSLQLVGNVIEFYHVIFEHCLERSPNFLQLVGNVIDFPLQFRAFE